MAQIINEYRGLGSALGSGFGSALSEIAQHKLDSLKSQAGARAGIKTLTDLDIDPVSARFIQDQPAKQRAGLVAEYFKQKDAQAQQAPQESPLGQILNSPQEDQMPQQLGGGLASLFNNGLSGGGINPQFLQQLQQQSQPQQPQMAQQPAQQEQPAPQARPQEAAKPHDILKKALASGSGDVAQERARTAKQSAIDRQNAPFNKGLTAGVMNAEKALDILNNMEQLLDTKKVSSGLYGKVPSILQNSESQQFEANADALAQQLAGQSGVAGAFKIRFAQNLKPKLTDKEQTQRDRIQFLKKEAEKVLRKAQLRDEIIEENGGYQLPNMESLINKRYKELQKSGTNQSSFDELPDPAKYFALHGKTPVDNDETGESFISDGKKWIRES